jgi:RNA polymerase sigma factor (sigma-70 family)
VKATPTSETELAGLMRAGLRGDAAAYRSLLGGLSAALRAYYKRRLAAIGRSASEAEDLTQEALMAIHTRRHTYDPAVPLLPWVHAIARYKLIDHLRRTRASSMDVPIESSEDLVGESDYAAAESAYDMQRLLGKLPSKMRRSIEAVKLEGRSVAETAQRAGISESDVKISVHRGLKALAAAVVPKRTTS